MQTPATKSKAWRNKKRAGRRPDIAADAAKLGVHRSTLYRALRGETSNPEIVARYRDLLKLRAKLQPPHTTL
jgi:DNA-binding phage protein